MKMEQKLTIQMLRLLKAHLQLKNTWNFDFQTDNCYSKPTKNTFWQINWKQITIPQARIYHDKDTSWQGYIMTRVYHDTDTSWQGYIITRVYHDMDISWQGYIMTRIHHDKDISRQGYIMTQIHHDKDIS